MLRFAFAPTADLSIADLRNALLNSIVARQRGEGFILRIEDGDRARSIEGKDQEAQEILKKFAIHPELVIYQSEQERRYQQLAVKLVEEKKAFLCICSREDLEKERERARAEGRPYHYSGHCAQMSVEEIRRIKEEKIPFTIRLRKPLEAITFTDLFRGEIRAEPNEVDHFVILRSDGTATDEFAGACDDMLGGVTLVIRGEERLADTPKEIHVRSSLGYDSGVEYAHLPPLLDEQGKKISGKNTTWSVKRLLEDGYLPDAIINYLLLLGNDTPAEIFTLPEAVEWVDLRKLSRSPAPFSLDELRRINREHLRRMDDVALSRIFGFADAAIGRLAKLYLEEASTIRELDSIIRTIFAPKKCQHGEDEEMKSLSALILEAPMLETFEDFKSYLMEKSGLPDEKLHKPLHRLITGAEKGPELSDIYKYIKPYITEVARCQP